MSCPRSSWIFRLISLRVFLSCANKVRRSRHWLRANLDQARVSSIRPAASPCP
ncbi:hypothetical protein PF010_g19012 [Phytophthora fragariae]|uniref:RxLR effector protein n=1 Tax=Phytophthora fragariae TaxID=53985 RepID=A0A6A3E9B2_9STRA|nr:hypothetical protein PF003_g3182 [Phytophthora fragariae]KAE8929063.1 hypothetical protein PF009_g20808 [Phytophthora fragariae]KAE9089373.1 hypothetical protein PF010_g19012 [Phytophthora fragariae]KAE9091260.1 hypothetical protein PF007_g18943 [Phytophthora fragariae]KAE9118192.1 hypothetical protein PF006_g18651 [Phytophthora fragariae]